MSNQIRNDPDANDEKAMDLICRWTSPTETKFPSDLEKYLENNEFKVIVNAGNELQRNFELKFFQKLRLRECAAGPGEKHKVIARVAPMVEPALTGGAPFQAGRFATINLAVPGLVISPQLTGCCLVMGFDKDSTMMYMGHAKVAAPHNREELAQQMKDVKPGEMFAGISNVKKIKLFGGNKNGYGDGTADILGWVSGNKFFLVYRIQHPGKPKIKCKVVSYP